MKTELDARLFITGPSGNPEYRSTPIGKLYSAYSNALGKRRSKGGAFSDAIAKLRDSANDRKLASSFLFEVAKTEGYKGSSVEEACSALGVLVPQILKQEKAKPKPPKPKATDDRDYPTDPVGENRSSAFKTRRQLPQLSSPSTDTVNDRIGGFTDRPFNPDIDAVFTDGKLTLGVNPEYGNTYRIIVMANKRGDPPKRLSYKNRFLSIAGNGDLNFENYDGGIYVQGRIIVLLRLDLDNVQGGRREPNHDPNVKYYAGREICMGTDPSSKEEFVGYTFYVKRSSRCSRPPVPGFVGKLLEANDEHLLFTHPVDGTISIPDTYELYLGVVNGTFNDRDTVLSQLGLGFDYDKDAEYDNLTFHNGKELEANKPYKIVLIEDRIKGTVGKVLKDRVVYEDMAFDRFNFTNFKLPLDGRFVFIRLDDVPIDSDSNSLPSLGTGNQAKNQEGLIVLDPSDPACKVNGTVTEFKEIKTGEIYNLKQIVKSITPGRDRVDIASLTGHLKTIRPDGNSLPIFDFDPVLDSHKPKTIRLANGKIEIVKDETITKAEIEEKNKALPVEPPPQRTFERRTHAPREPRYREDDERPSRGTRGFWRHGDPIYPDEGITRSHEIDFEPIKAGDYVSLDNEIKIQRARKLPEGTVFNFNNLPGYGECILKSIVVDDESPMRAIFFTDSTGEERVLDLPLEPFCGIEITSLPADATSSASSEIKAGEVIPLNSQSGIDRLKELQEGTEFRFRGWQTLEQEGNCVFKGLKVDRDKNILNYKKESQEDDYILVPLSHEISIEITFLPGLQVIPTNEVQDIPGLKAGQILAKDGKFYPDGERLKYDTPYNITAYPRGTEPFEKNVLITMVKDVGGKSSIHYERQDGSFDVIYDSDSLGGILFEEVNAVLVEPKQKGKIITSINGNLSEPLDTSKHYNIRFIDKTHEGPYENAQVLSKGDFGEFNMLSFNMFTIRYGEQTTDIYDSWHGGIEFEEVNS